MLEAERDYVRLHVIDLVRATLRDVEARLNPELFVRAHRSTIIPIDRNTKLQRYPSGGWVILLSTGASVRVGRSFQSLVRNVTTGSATASCMTGLRLGG